MNGDDRQYEPADFRDPHADGEFDCNLVLSLLELTPEQRLERHEAWRRFVMEFRGAAFREANGFDPRLPEAAQ